MEERFSGLNKKIRDFFDSHNISAPSQSFSITFASDALLKDNYGRFVSRLEPEMILPALAGKVSLVFSCCSLTKVSGWNQAWSLPKRDELALAKGSVFLFESSENLQAAEINQLIKELSLLETRGVGSRRNEGFGKVMICDPFH
ncbi:MAG: hypothetical protein HZA01_16790 [Nitrospinae bacterium]|nr:hypothetical protein [Nitrospinota bacterium]